MNLHMISKASYSSLEVSAHLPSPLWALWACDRVYLMAPAKLGYVLFQHPQGHTQALQLAGASQGLLTWSSRERETSGYNLD